MEGAALWADKISMEDSSEEQLEATDSIEKAIRLNETKEETKLGTFKYIYYTCHGTNSFIESN